MTTAPPRLPSNPQPEVASTSSTSGKRSSSDRFLMLDVLRGFAALWVFSFHLTLSSQWQHVPLVLAFTRKGYLGVPVFFVISGYCIAAAATSAARRGGVKSFLHRRLRRIYPTFWASVALVVALPFIIEGISALKTGSMQWPAKESIGYLSYGPWDWVAMLSLAQAFEPTGASLQQKFASLNSVYWTLALEVQFYLVVAVALAAGRRMFMVLGLVTIVSLPFAVIDRAYTWGIFLPYWPMFAIGTFIFWLVSRGVTPRVLAGQAAPVVTTLGIAIVCLSVVFVVSANQPVWILVALLFGCLIYLSYDGRIWLEQCLTSTSRLTALCATLAIHLGLMSYSVYLLHAKLDMLSLQVVSQALREPSILRDSLVVLGTLALCYPFYLICERPFTGPRVKRPATSAGQPADSVEPQPPQDLAALVPGEKREYSGGRGH